jgi:hypothetical protein
MLPFRVLPSPTDMALLTEGVFVPLVVYKHDPPGGGCPRSAKRSRRSVIRAWLADLCVLARRFSQRG